LIVPLSVVSEEESDGGRESFIKSISLVDNVAGWVLAAQHDWSTRVFVRASS